MSIITLLTDFHQVLNTFNTAYCIDNDGKILFEDLYPLEEAIRSLSNENDSWEYEIAPFVIKLPAVQNHTFTHQTSISIVFQAHNVLNSTNDVISNPINLKKFDIHLKGRNAIANIDSMASWHLDDQSELSDANDGQSKYLHPVYHFTFGGKLMEGSYLDNWDFGQTLVMRSPRLMHPPMDIILGIDFILTQFIARKYITDLLDKPEYKKIIQAVKQKIWKPYALAFAKNFCNDWATETSTLTFDDEFCKSIIEH